MAQVLKDHLFPTSLPWTGTLLTVEALRANLITCKCTKDKVHFSPK